MLGCIPRTPSPESEIATPSSPVISREQKVRDLRVSRLSGTQISSIELTQHRLN